MSEVDLRPTVIVVHRRERRSKCSVEPLRGRPGFQFLDFPSLARPDLNGYVRLGLGGPMLTPADRSSGLLVLDATWRRAVSMEEAYAATPIRSIPSWRTAYPRVSKNYPDPSQGLATIEAIFAAYVETGRQTDGLLDGYYWADQFLELNRDRLRIGNKG